MSEKGFDGFLDNSEHPIPHRGGLIFILGILGFITVGILGAIAWYLGNSDLHKMNAGLMDAKGINSTEYGRILGIISLGIWLVLGVLALVIWGFTPLRQS